MTAIVIFTIPLLLLVRLPQRTRAPAVVADTGNLRAGRAG